tara:strand:- start:82 stop:546 length:465 start_codon:yes stop_codon:yes gene_type:complete
MLELLLLANFVILVLIYLQGQKNIKEIDRYIAAIDLSLREFFANIETTTQRKNIERDDEILRQLDKISNHSGMSASILNQVHNLMSIEDEYYENKENLKSKSVTPTSTPEILEVLNASGIKATKHGKGFQVRLKSGQLIYVASEGALHAFASSL